MCKLIGARQLRGQRYDPVYLNLTRSVTVGALLLVFALLAAVAPRVSGFEDPAGSPGLHDMAERFDQNEREAIERAIDHVEDAGAPTVVYLRLLHTEEDQAVEDGQRLMEAWDIESEPGARDGVVIFFNLEPDDPDRGEFGIVAGEAHYDEGALPQSRLDRVRDEMIDLLVEDEMAEAIVVGLEMTADYLEAGPPQPTVFETFVDQIASGPVSLLNALSLAAAALLGVIGWRTWQRRPTAGNLYEEKVTRPPGDLHPALAGALVRGNVADAQVEALMLNLARNGAIALEPDPEDEKKVRVRLLNQRANFTAYELELLRILAESGGEDQMLDQDALGKTQVKWSNVQNLIREELEQLGWFDRDAGRRAAPLWITGIIALGLGLAAAFIPLTILEQGWSLIGGGALLLLGAIVIGMAASFPRTTVDGERKAVPWRGYRRGLEEAARQGYGSIDLDEAFQYIVALGLPNNFRKHFEQANEAGYVPDWIVATDRRYRHHSVASNWFIYWSAFHTSMTYSSSSGSGSTAGGAATGSGGAGGRF